MKRPAWATFVAIVLIFFGLFSGAGSLIKIINPPLVETENDIIAREAKSNLNQNLDSEELIDLESELEKQESATASDFKEKANPERLPNWYRSSASIFGVVAMLLALFYIVSGILFLRVSHSAIRFFNRVLGFSIIWSLTLILVYATAGSYMLYTLIAGNVISIVIDAILLVLVAIVDREAYGYIRD